MYITDPVPSSLPPPPHEQRLIMEPCEFQIDTPTVCVGGDSGMDVVL